MNVGTVFQLLRDGKPRTRTELAVMTGLARSTVGAHVEKLARLALIGPADERLSSGGRPSASFSTSFARRVVIGVELDDRGVRVATMDLTGRLLTWRYEPGLPADKSPGELALIRRTITGVLSELSRTDDDILAIGIARALGSATCDEDMLQALAAPVVFCDTVDARALAERDAGAARLSEHALLYMDIGWNISSRVIANGATVRGAQGVAGDLRHAVVVASCKSGAECACGSTTCLDTVASGAAVVRALQEQIADISTIVDVISLVDSDHHEVIQAVRAAGRAIGQVVASCVSILNPSQVVIGGELSEGRTGGVLLAGVRESIYARAAPAATNDLAVTAAHLGAVATVTGACVGALEHALRSEAVDRMADSLREATSA